MTEVNKKRIAKNTLALYVRMILVMAITLFTSRIVLEKLGVTDYGIYNSVGGVVAMLGFLNGTLSTGTSRFLTFEIGTGNSNKLRLTFSTAFYTHLILALIVFLVLVTGGAWFVLNKLIIPEDLKTAALYTLYISAFTALINITQVPYTSVIIAHEKMNIYAYLGLFEAISKLGIAYAITISPIEKLVWYALMIATLQIIVVLIYRIFCIRHYEESHLTKTFDKKIFSNMLGFSGWSLIANVSELLSTQGLIVLINMFFAPAIAAAQAIGNQISSALAQFSSNFMVAINPQIIKLYAAGDRVASRKLNLQGTVLVWDLMLLIGLPLIVCMNPLVHLWLVDVPPYAVIFAQYIVTRQICNTFSMTFYTPMVASGELKGNSIACIWLGIGEFVLLYILLKCGLDVMWVQYISILQALAFGFGVKPYILCRKIGYSFQELIKCYMQCFKSAIIPIIVCFLLFRYFEIDGSLLKMIIIAVAIMLTVVVCAFITMEATMRQQLINFVRKKIHFRKSL